MATDPNPGVPDPEEAAVLRSTLGALLQELRTEAGVSTRTLAARSATARSTITRLEAGQRRPRPVILAALAYGLDPDRAPELAERLGEAAGPSLRPDTEGGRRRAARRRRTREKAVERRVDEIHRRAGTLMLRSKQLTQAALRLLHPRADFETIELAGRLHQEALLLQEEGLRLDGIACSPRHPLADPPLV